MKEQNEKSSLTEKEIQERNKHYEEHRVVLANVKHNGYLKIDDLIDNLIRLSSIGANVIVMEKKKNSFKAIRLPEKKQSNLILTK